MTKFGQVRWARKDGGPPITADAASPPGESGVRVLRAQFDGGAHFSVNTQQHLICFQMSKYLRLECRMAGRALAHETVMGALAICPAGIDCSADTDASADILILAVSLGISHSPPPKMPRLTRS